MVVDVRYNCTVGGCMKVDPTSQPYTVLLNDVYSVVSDPKEFFLEPTALLLRSCNQC
jgi:hypothetical protein